MLHIPAMVRLIARTVRPVGLIAATLSLGTSPVAAQVVGYLNKAPLGYEIPPPAMAANDVEMDLNLVRALRAVPGSLAEDEAIGDAQAYFVLISVES